MKNIWNKTKEFINKYGEKILGFILNSRKNFVLSAILGLGLVYVGLVIFDKNEKIDKTKIEDIDKSIIEDKNSIKKIDSLINELLKKIDSVNVNISDLESKKTIIKEIYYEKIDRVSNYDDAQLDSFFTVRYGYTPR
jgi:hypothetical protein